MNYELFPVRCFSCGKVLGSYQTSYEDLINQGVEVGKAMDQLGIKRICCRTNVMNPIKISPAPLLVPPSHETLYYLPSNDDPTTSIIPLISTFETSGLNQPMEIQHPEIQPKPFFPDDQPILPEMK